MKKKDPYHIEVKIIRLRNVLHGNFNTKFTDKLLVTVADGGLDDNRELLAKHQIN